MPTSKTAQWRSRTPEYRREYHQRARMAVRDNAPLDAEPCQVCGVPISYLGLIPHLRVHVRNGELDELPPIKKQQNRNTKKTPPQPRSERTERNKFVAKIAKLPYREFLEELLK